MTGRLFVYGMAAGWVLLVLRLDYSIRSELRAAAACAERAAISRVGGMAQMRRWMEEPADAE